MLFNIYKVYYSGAAFTKKPAYQQLDRREPTLTKNPHKIFNYQRQLLLICTIFSIVLHRICLGLISNNRIRSTCQRYAFIIYFAKFSKTKFAYFIYYQHYLHIKSSTYGENLSILPIRSNKKNGLENR